MSRPDFPRSVLAFQRRFPTEEACHRYLVESRWPDGFQCPQCTTFEHYLVRERMLLQCKRCSYQTSVTAGTVLHRSKMPLMIWFQAAWLVATQTPGMSAVQFARQVGLKNYETAFLMLHKLRAAMVRKGREPLRGIVEVDEAYVGGSEARPLGRAARIKAIVVGAVEVRGKVAGRVRLRAISRVSAAELHAFVKEEVQPGSELRTDGYGGYIGLRDQGYRHAPVTQGHPTMASKILPHIHRVFSNLKSWLLGTHHGAVSKHHLPAYLNEFTFRFNRRRTPLAAFQTVLGLTAQRRGPTYAGLYGLKKATLRAWSHPH